MKQSNNRKTILSREKWLELAIEILAHGCKTKFNLDALIKVMPVSKGSFYSHFKSRNDFLVALVEYWDRHDTKLAVDLIQTLPADMSGQDKLWELMCAIYELKFTQYELLIRSLTLEIPEIYDLIKNTDRKRLQVVGQLFAEMGFEGDELEMRAATFVTTMSMEGSIFRDVSPDAYVRQLKLRHQFFIRQ